jgi:S-formylglutathione hydrolase FrmB
VPEGYSGNQRYPLLILLHGFNQRQQDWVEKTALREYLKGVPLFIAIPQGDNSWYVNSMTDTSLRYESYILEDVVGRIADRYSIDTSRMAIAGLSMGGGGALRIALRNPGTFKVVASFSGAILYPRFLGDTVLQSVSAASAASLARAFGTQRTDEWKKHDVFELYRSVPPDRLPFLYLAVGIQDGLKSFLPLHRQWTDSLRAAGVAYEYHETPGAHRWEFWDREIKRFLPRLRELLQF